MRVATVLVCMAIAGGCDKKKTSARGAQTRGPSTASVEEPETPPPAPVTRALQFYEGRPYFEQPVARAGSVDGLPDVRASTCGGCHAAIFEEWQVSTHRRAWGDDAQFQAELEKSRGGSDPDRGDVGWLCVNCHTPMTEQLPRLVVGLEDGEIDRPMYVDNPEFDPELQTEAITCATCHVRDGVILGPFGSANAPHPVRRDDTLKSVDVCVRCHQAEQFYAAQNLGCFFTTGAEWRSSPYSAQGRTCQTCHMPEIRRKIASGGPVRTTRRHWFGGSLIPKKPKWADELEPLESVYGDGLTITLEPMSERWEKLATDQPDLAVPDLQLAESRRTACSGECEPLALVVTNDRAGHYVPSGDPERHVDVAVVVRRDEDVVSRNWTRFGSRYQWWPETELLADTRIPATESRVLVVEVPAGGEATVEVTAHKYRMYPEAFAHHELEGEYVRGRQFFGGKWQVRDGKVAD